MWPELDMHDLAAAEICKSYVPKAVLRQLPARFELVGRLVSDIDRVDRRLPSVHDSAIHDGRKLLTNSCTVTSRQQCPADADHGKSNAILIRGFLCMLLSKVAALVFRRGRLGLR